MSIWQVIILAFVQGLAELLPVSSSAHVVVAEKLMGLDPSSPEMTLVLVLLHTGTMFAVILYFWKQWKQSFFSSAHTFWRIALRLVVATVVTAIVGGGLMKAIEKIFGHGQKIEPEQFFGRLDMIAPALLAAGILILIAGWKSNTGKPGSEFDDDGTPRPCLKQASIMGAVQGLCLPFRGFSRSGATISSGLLMGVARAQAEAFSFALAVLITPPVVAREVLRLIKIRHLEGGAALGTAVLPGVLGMVCAFLAGLLALKWLSQWLESGKWYLFGIYCVAASIAVGVLHHLGY
ncbi:MAG TPA: undecaprenyl-diphosphate phosphatase [Acidobacteriaceae bacterium]